MLLITVFGRDLQRSWVPDYKCSSNIAWTSSRSTSAYQTVASFPYMIFSRFLHAQWPINIWYTFYTSRFLNFFCAFPACCLHHSSTSHYGTFSVEIDESSSPFKYMALTAKYFVSSLTVLDSLLNTFVCCTNVFSAVPLFLLRTGFVPQYLSWFTSALIESFN